MPHGDYLEKGDHVKVMGKDGFYVFLAEAQGRATLRVGGRKNIEHPTLDVPINHVMSLEHYARTEKGQRG